LPPWVSFALPVTLWDELLRQAIGLRLVGNREKGGGCVTQPHAAAVDPARTREE
jgi:hypothetical protein